MNLTLECVKCGKKYDPEGWDPLGGDCPIVRDLTTGEVIQPPEYQSTPAHKGDF